MAVDMEAKGEMTASQRGRNVSEWERTRSFHVDVFDRPNVYKAFLLSINPLLHDLLRCHGADVVCAPLANGFRLLGLSQQLFLGRERSHSRSHFRKATFPNVEKMSRVEANWERLARAALRWERAGADDARRPVSGIAGNVPASLGNNLHIDEILRAADEIQEEDPNISRILCEHAYSLAQNLDPNSVGRGVLQFKTGLMSVIKQKLAKRDGGIIDRSQDIARLQEFYKQYREKHNVDQLREDEMKMRESGVFSGNLGELERKTVRRKKVFATLKVLGTVLEELTKEISPEAAKGLITEEMKRVMESDAAMTEDVVAYNIIPFDSPSTTNAIVGLPEVRAAISSLKYYRGLPKLPSEFSIPSTRSSDILDFLHCVFGFQKDNVSNQREHIIHLLANEQSWLGIPIVGEPDDLILEELVLHPSGAGFPPSLILASLCCWEREVGWLDWMASYLVATGIEGKVETVVVLRRFKEVSGAEWEVRRVTDHSFLVVGKITEEVAKMAAVGLLAVDGSSSCSAGRSGGGLFPILRQDISQWS
ncbi:hypothetical protein Taro_023861 [Colocasia esculenta]|uniref:Uncharacterized protein n=1 Tax=Colocasia esculenta TaxID=4460 RepID=A0A843V7M4_COLES|nr:hypothetical protein [Colocasia esculenta]